MWASLVLKFGGTPSAFGQKNHNKVREFAVLEHFVTVARSSPLRRCLALAAPKGERLQFIFPRKVNSLVGRLVFRPWDFTQSIARIVRDVEPIVVSIRPRNTSSLHVLIGHPS